VNTLSNEFKIYAKSIGTEKVVILSKDDFRFSSNDLDDNEIDVIEKIQNNPIWETFSTLVLLGIFGYDEYHSNYSKFKKNTGLTGCHGNYWKVAENIGEELSAFLGNKGFIVQYTGENSFSLPTKQILSIKGISKYGKNSLAYVDEYGSWINNWVYLFTNAPLRGEHANISKLSTLCGNCDVCIKKCPTGAISSPFKVDREKCLVSILQTDIVISEDIRDKIGNWLWGCDICQVVCPTNLKVKSRIRAEDAGLYHPSKCTLPEHSHPFPNLILELKEEYNRLYLRNVLVALGNVGDFGAIEAVESFAQKAEKIGLGDYSNWALKKLKERN
jgi:epoxyqueuosine reductase